jgi:DNA-binding transcriptional LysR family regulator
MDRLQYFLAALQERDPGLRTNVTHASPEAQVEWLNNMELDVGIFRSEGHHGIETEALFAGEPLMAYLHTGHPLAAKPVLGTDDLTQERLIGLPLESASEQCVGLRKQLRDLGYRFAAVYEPPGLDPRDLMLAVADGHGILLATRAMADTTRANGIVVRRPLDPTIPLPDIVVAWRADPPAHLAPILATIRHVARRIREAPRD